MEFGTVKFFDARENRLYGFILPSNGGPDIWFHLGDWRKLEAQDGDVVFINEIPRLTLPRTGDRVVFERAPGKDGKPKACPWNHELQYELAEITVEFRKAQEVINADLHELAAMAGSDEAEDNLIPDTVFTDHDDADDEEPEERSFDRLEPFEDCPGCGKKLSHCVCDEEAEECTVCGDLMSDCECDDGDPDDEEFEDNSESPDADAEFFDDATILGIKGEETPDIDL